MESQIDEIRQETMEKKPEIPTWLDEINGIWADMFHSVLDETSDEYFDNDIIVMRVMELQKFLYKIEFSLYSGFYYSLNRDLRFFGGFYQSIPYR
ncbi:MAG: hypothetical protein ABEK16_03060 [Candidatus Nanohalobium sp.]